MILRKPQYDLDNPPGQITHVPTLSRGIEEWEREEEQRKKLRAVFMEGYRVGYAAGQRERSGPLDPSSEESR